MGKITITIEAASLEEAQEMMRVKACAPISYAEVGTLRESVEAYVETPDAQSFSEYVARGSVGGLNPEHSSIPKPTAPTEQPATEPSAPIAGGTDSTATQTPALDTVHAATAPATEPSAPTAPGAASVESATTTPTSAVATAPISETAPPATAPATSNGVELDSDGLPWDSRIHSSSRKKLAKTQQWKKARGVDADLVARVEAELRQAMAIPTPQRPESMAQSDHAREMTAESELTPPTPSRSAFAESDAAAAFGIPGPSTTRLDPPPPTQEAEAPQPDATIAETTATPATTAPAPSAPAPAQTGNAPKTLAELNALVLGAGMQLADVLPAVQEVGLASYALLGTRPDLIPEVARRLGLGG